MTNDTITEHRRLWLGIGAVVIVGLCVTAYRRPSGLGIGTTLDRGPIPVTAQTVKQESQKKAIDYVVHVAGQVHRPGVYRLEAGARVVDANQKAGGALPKADLSQINLASKLQDGQQIRVMSASNPANKSVAISMNQSGKEALMRLPGVGPALAKRLIEGRPYRSKKDLLTIKGVGPKTLKKWQGNYQL